ncbi:hypothetical protein BEWA_046210 [Theileria equi strain WA]|uniref:Uncharacterized protein n=1 Tax=Theileria equi strain WA TaxID=1537102 RepID=L1L9Q5_THEEQ|nr:hypothetical protein BEWA_046210 [Theileria equi strain WA]EKX72157.1 hypothetical protein BEWA_046210 [Theileria equi strain WA]|eukprot:XP_004831609.1 hypothetical protein BEWA_046210 [Theileria equi strain WA]
MSGRVLTLNVDGNCGKSNNICRCRDKPPGITARKETDQPKGFIRVTHQHKSGNKFTLNNKLQGGGKIGELIHNVTEVSVFYWNGAPDKAILLGITITNTPIYYAKNSDNDWIGQPPLSDDLLETKLDEQNCKHNNAVTINLSKGTFMSGDSKHSYCCSGNHSDGARGSNRVTVTSAQISCKLHENPSSIPFHKHEITYSGGVRLAAIKYNDGKHRKRINSSGLDFPIQGPLSVYAFHCSGNPALIYVDSSSDSSKNGWYKKYTGSSTVSGDEQWVEVFTISNIQPRELSNTIDHEKYNGIVGILKTLSGCTSYKECPKPEEKPKAVPPETTTPDNAALTEDGQKSPTSAKVIAAPAAAVLGPWAIFGASSGPIAGAGGLTGFGWWIYKRTKGDPWVRQI